MLIFLGLLCCNAFAGIEPPAFPVIKDTLAITVPVSDTSAIHVITPSKAKEEAVFADQKLKYKGDVKAAPGFFDTFLAWLAYKLFGKVSPENVGNARNIIVWSTVMISLVVLIRLLLRTDLVSLTKQKAKSTAFNFTDLTEDLNAVNFDQRIAEALKNADYRLATRWQYLKMLFLLDKKQVISFAPYKTNIDYKYEIRDKNLQDVFTSLSRIYEYVWYGRFVITEYNYALNSEKFSALEKQLNV